MQSPPLHSLESVCKRYGPGRLPRASREDIGAGYAAACAAFVATILFGVILVAWEALHVGVDAVPGLVFFAFPLPFVVPAAFLVGVVGWRVLPSTSAAAGVTVGAIGTILTYLVAFVLLSTVLVVAGLLSLTGAEPTSAVMFSFGFLVIGVRLTWWVTIPIGCLAGYVYVNVTGSSP